MIIKENRKKPLSLIHQIGTALKFSLQIIILSISAVFNFKNKIALILMTIFIWSFLFAFFVHRRSDDLGLNEMAKAFNLRGRDFKHKTSESFKSVIFAPFRWMQANLSDQGIPSFNIDIKFKDMQRLILKRDDAINSGILIKEDNDYVPGRIRFNNKNYKIKIRLKGDWIDHLEGDKWSFRIHIKGDNHFLGMKRLSIQHPRTRNFETEILLFEALKREGVLVPRYFFVEVSINGKNIGLMALEEHFSKELLESQRRKEGVIIRFNEDSFWKSGLINTFDNFKIAQIIPFRSNKVARSKKLSNDLILAKNLLKGFVRGDLKPLDVFDPIIMGKFIAIADVWGATHMLRWHNFRFYYNPITALLEPIGFDADLRTEISRSSSALDEPIVSAIIEGDPVIKLVYRKTVEKLVQEMEKGTTNKWFQAISKKQLGILHKEFPLLNGIRFEEIAKRGREALARISIARKYPEVLQVKSIRSKSSLYLELINPLTQPIKVEKIYCDEKSTRENKLILDNSIKLPLTVKPTFLGERPEEKRISYNLIKKDFKCDTVLNVRIAGEEMLRTIRSEKSYPTIKKQVLPNFNLKETLDLHPFIKYVEGKNFLQVLPGVWQVNEWISVPKTMTLEISKGTTLRFEKKSGLIANGPVNLKGTREEPVILMGSDHLSGFDTWSGIALMKTQKSSIWSHVKIFKTSGVSKGDWSLTGGINFYESDIIMDNVSFFGNQSEDALNIVRSKFNLKNIIIKNTTSDGFDSDFSNGTIENGRFENIGSQAGGDGVDVSGSIVKIINSYFENISDKGISVGENSNLTATNIDIKNADIGVASKDGSLLSISDSKFSEIRKAGLMSYNKKSEYGSPEILAKNISIESIGDKFISQNGSKITIDGVETASVELDVKKLYSLEVD